MMMTLETEKGGMYGTRKVCISALSFTLKCINSASGKRKTSAFLLKYGGLRYFFSLDMRSGR